MQLSSKLHQFIWQDTTTPTSPLKSNLVLFLRIISLVIKDLIGGMLSLRAMSLVYTTLLSLVPLIAVSFSVLKGFGVHNQIEPMLANLLLPLGDKGPEITAQIISFVDNMKMGVLGSVGLVMLMYTVISLISKIESAFNYTWRIDSVRSPAQRFSNYLSIVMVGPVMMFAAIGLTASLSSNTVIDALNSYAVVGQILKFAGYLLPFIFIIAAFAFIYLLVPNTRVNVKSALYGAFFSGVVWELLGRAFASFASGSTSYTAIYSGFAILILFMIWLYLGWLVLLTGANIAYYHQHSERLKWDNEKFTLTPSIQEQSLLHIMYYVSLNHASSNKNPVTEIFLAKKLNLPSECISVLLALLIKDSFIKASNDDVEEFFPAQSIENITVAHIIQCSRQNLTNDNLTLPSDSVISNLLKQHDDILESTFNQTSFNSLVNKS